MRPAAYASTLLPIAAGYLIAHYLTLVIQGVVWLPSLLVDPLMSLAPDLGWIPVGAVWYLSVGAIVGGHIAGVVLAHRLALRDAPARATVAGLPMLAIPTTYAGSEMTTMFGLTEGGAKRTGRDPAVLPPDPDWD